MTYVSVCKPRDCGKSTTIPAAIRIITDDRHLARLALFAAKTLRNVDSIALHDLGEALDEAADRGCIHPFSDNSELVRIMQRLGWRKDGYAGQGGSRSPIYRRVATPLRKGGQ